MMAKHSPNPWKSSGYCRGKAYIHPDSYHILDANGGLVAAVKDKKNESLIKLAPDMHRALREYAKLHDMISDTIESGRLTEADIPDDYLAIADQLELCAGLMTKLDELIK